MKLLLECEPEDSLGALPVLIVWYFIQRRIGTRKRLQEETVKWQTAAQECTRSSWRWEKKKKISVIFVMIRNVFILGLEKHKQNVIVTKEIIGILWFKMVTAIATSTSL